MTVLSSLYFVLDNVSVAFFLLSSMTITLYLVMYMLMYAAVIKLRYSQLDRERRYKLPSGMFGVWGIGGGGFIGVLFAFVVVFFPPEVLPIGNPAQYVTLVGGGIIVFLAASFLISYFKKPE